MGQRWAIISSVRRKHRVMEAESLSLCKKTSDESKLKRIPFYFIPRHLNPKSLSCRAPHFRARYRLNVSLSPQWPQDSMTGITRERCERLVWGHQTGGMNQSGNSSVFLIQFYLGHVGYCVGVIHEFPLVHFNFPKPEQWDDVSKKFGLKQVETLSVSCSVNSRHNPRLLLKDCKSTLGSDTVIGFIDGESLLQRNLGYNQDTSGEKEVKYPTHA